MKNMNEKDFEQSKTLLENFEKLDDEVQNKLLNGVKCLSLLYDLTDTKDDNKISAQVVPQ